MISYISGQMKYLKQNIYIIPIYCAYLFAPIFVFNFEDLFLQSQLQVYTIMSTSASLK